jgi:hypothetical protein
MTEQKKTDQGNAKPIGTWGGGEPRDEAGSGTDRGTGMDPIPGTPGAAPLIDEPAAADQEPRTSPETEHELDRLRRG